MNVNKNPLPPYPRLGELYRAVAVSLGTKGNNADVDELARKGEFDWKRLSSLRSDLIVTPLAKDVDPEFASRVDQTMMLVHENYLNLVSTVSLDSLSREESLPLLIKEYFARHAMGLIFGVKRGFGGPDLARLFDHERHPVVVVLAWLDEIGGTPLAKLAYPETTDMDRNDGEKYRKWAKGKDLPSLHSIIRFSTALKDKGLGDEKLKCLRIWLIIARALGYLERESPVPFRAVMHQYLLLGMPDFDIGQTLSAAVIKSGERFSALKMPALILYEGLKRTTEKDVGEQERLKAELEQFERMALEVEPERRTQFHFEWMRGRWHVLSGEFDLALPHYELAAELAMYRAGDQQKQIIEETLVLAAHLSKKALIKRLKHQAIAFGLFSNPEGDVVEDWEVAQFDQQFYQVFPKHGRFPESLTEVAESGPLPFLVLDEDELAQFKLDLRQPNRKFSIRLRDGQVRRWSQLRLFASFNKFEEVKALLRAGASVEQLDESGGSALLCAIQQATQTEDRRVLDLLLEYPHTSAVLDSVTVKKRFAPLFCAIDLGEPDVVGSLLKMGASCDLRGEVAAQTPLYYALERLGAVVNPAKLYNFLLRSFLGNSDLLQRETLRRYNIGVAGTFGEKETIRKLLDNPGTAEAFKVIASTIVAEHNGRHTVQKIIRVIELLLEHGANPNIPHSYPEPGRTPLMLAAESDSAQAFELMLRHNGDPYRTDQAGMNCIKIAMAFRSSQVINYMRGRGIM